MTTTTDATPPGPTATHLSAELLARQAARESEVRSYPRRIPVAIESARGVMVTDVEGRSYVDCLAGAGALALGHHHPVVVDAITGALATGAPLTTLDLATPLKDRFTSELVAALPPAFHDGRLMFCGPTGADAVEAAVKLARTVTARSTVVAFGGGYHGMTQGALALTGNRAPKEPLGAEVVGVHHLPFPAGYRCPLGEAGDASAQRCAALVDWTIDDTHSGVTSPAAIIVEPVQGEGGVHPAPEGFARALRAAADRSGAVLIADEVQTGLGRTGATWASTEIGLDPDVIVMSKAIGGGLPLAVLAIREGFDAFSPGAHAGTFRGNQLAFAAGAATIRHVVDHDLATHARRMGERLTAGLREAAGADERVGDVRGRGLMVGAEIVEPGGAARWGRPPEDGRTARMVQAEMLRRGVIVEVGGRHDAVVRFLPPLVIDAPVIDRVVEVFAESLAAVPA